jgi:ABC-2 type transport system ATP-binding protein
MFNDTLEAMNCVIETSGLRMRYGPRDVLFGVDLRVERGEVLALLGPNGAGKTTTVEILEGFRRRTDGEVRVLGVDPQRAGEEWRARVGVVLQSWRDHGRWRVRELLDHLRRYYPSPHDIDELIVRVGLTGQENQLLARLSGGQRRRLDVAVGLVGRPELLFLDEPTVGFDPQGRNEFHEMVRGLAAETTILLTTHDLDEAEKLADRIAILVGGRIVADGTRAALVAGDAEVRHTLDGSVRVEKVADPTTHVRELFESYGKAVGDLEVRRARLEDVYLSMVKEAA